MLVYLKDEVDEKPERFACYCIRSLPYRIIRKKVCSKNRFHQMNSFFVCDIINMLRYDHIQKKYDRLLIDSVIMRRDMS